MRAVATDDDWTRIRTSAVGFVYNDMVPSGRGPTAAKMNLLHKASCPWLRRMNLGVPKYEGDDLDDVVAWLQAKRGAEGESWTCCATCLAGPRRPERVRSSTSNQAADPLTTSHALPALQELGAATDSIRSWWIPGRPATFATAAETAWKAAVAAVVPTCTSTHAETSVRAEFHLGDDQLGKNEPDLDNLLEPLLSVVVNRCRWFAGRRPNILSVAATKRYARPTGCQLTLVRGADSPLRIVGHLGSFAFPGPLPTSARDPVLAGWLVAKGAAQVPDAPLAIGLRFGGPVNLGDIATGKVKTTIDGLWPLLGGVAGAPADTRISSLLLHRDDPKAPAAGVTIEVALAGSS